MEEGRALRELAARALRLTTALYRVTDLLAHEEPLRRGLREKAGEIFASVVVCGAEGSAGGDTDRVWTATEILLGYLAIARTLGSVNPVNFMVLEREYRGLLTALPPRGSRQAVSAEQPVKQDAAGAPHQIASMIKKETGHGAVPGPAQKNPLAYEIGADIDGRKKAIIERLSDKGQARISDFYATFPDISSKTIQRELKDLVERNILKKEGDRKTTVYVLR